MLLLERYPTDFMLEWIKNIFLPHGECASSSYKKSMWTSLISYPHTEEPTRLRGPTDSTSIVYIFFRSATKRTVAPLIPLSLSLSVNGETEKREGEGSSSSEAGEEDSGEEEKGTHEVSLLQAELSPAPLHGTSPTFRIPRRSLFFHYSHIQAREINSPSLSLSHTLSLLRREGLWGFPSAWTTPAAT